MLALSPGASEHGAGDQAPPVQEQDSLPRPTLVWGETGSEHVDREDPLLQGTNFTNEIPTTDHLFTHGPAVATEAYQDLMEQALATPPETEEAEPGEANELVTDAAGPSGEIPCIQVLRSNMCLKTLTRPRSNFNAPTQKKITT